MTPAVEKALADAKAKATPVARQGEEPDQEPVEDVSDVDAMVDQALADARTAPAPQQGEPKPVPEWSAAEKVAKFRLIWNCPEDEEEPEEVEDICVDNPEFYRTAGRVRSSSTACCATNRSLGPPGPVASVSSARSSITT